MHPDISAAPPRVPDYGLTGANGALAIESGLAEWLVDGFSVTNAPGPQRAEDSQSGRRPDH